MAMRYFLKAARRIGRFVSHCTILGILVCLVDFFFVVDLSIGQPKTLRFQHLSLNDGLSSYVITALDRDTTGFLWVGTRRGLNRYDGIRCKKFLPGDEYGSLKDYGITVLARDKRNKEILWIGTERGGPVQFNSVTERFTPLAEEELSRNSIGILSLHSSLDGELWLGLDGGGLTRFCLADSSIETFLPAGGEKLLCRAIHHSPLRPGELLIGTDSGLFLFNTSSNSFHFLTLPYGNKAALGHRSITAIAEVDGGIWVGTASGGLFRYDMRLQTIEDCDRISRLTESMGISTMAASKIYPGLLWIGTRGRGLLAFNTQTGRVNQFTYKAGEPSSLSRDDVLSIIEDEAGLLWVGTITGLNKASLHARGFTPVFLEGDGARSEAGPSVGTIHQSEFAPYTIWFSVLREGLRKYNRKTNVSERLLISNDSLEVIFAMKEDNRGNLWLGGNHPVLFCWDHSSRHLTSYRLGNYDEPLITQIYEIPSQPDFLWISMRRVGLLKFDINERRVVRRYTVEDGLASNDVWSVFEPVDKSEMLWIITAGTGLNLLNRATEEIRVINQANGYCLPSDDLLAIAQDSSGTLLLGTYNAGLLQFDPSTNECKSYTIADGLPGWDVGALQKDGRGRLWLSTSSGLSLFNPQSHEFTNFGTVDGLHGSIFHYQASHKNMKGEMIFGGIGGFTFFDPESIWVNTQTPNIAITDFQVAGVPYRLMPMPNGFNPFVLTYTQNDLTFEFASLDLFEPSKNRYKTMLEGADTEWQPIGTLHSQRYPSLSPGKYMFRVTGSNGDGYWNTKGVSLEFEILPPFWDTWWFWFLIAAIAFGLVISAYQYRISQLKHIERTRSRIANDLHDDIGSKMSSIALMVEMAGSALTLNRDQKEQIAEISKTARAVVDDLRDAIWIVDAENDDITALVERMKQVAAQMLRGHSFQLQTNDTLPPVTVRMEQRRNILLSYREMLHNVVRHAHASHINIWITYANGMLGIEIQDNGAGFDLLTVSYGRGLRNIQKRAELLHGGFQIVSGQSQGTKQKFVAKIV